MEFEKIKAIIADKMDIDPSTITEESSFEDLKMDSLDMVEIVMDVEDEFDISIETSEGIKTIADLIALIKSQEKIGREIGRRFAGLFVPKNWSGVKFLILSEKGATLF